MSALHNKALGKPETLALKIAQKGLNKSELEILGMATLCACVCLCVRVCMWITLSNGIKLTPLRKANFSVAFRQAVFQRIIS